MPQSIVGVPVADQFLFRWVRHGGTGRDQKGGQRKNQFCCDGHGGRITRRYGNRNVIQRVPSKGKGRLLPAGLIEEKELQFWAINPEAARNFLLPAYS